MPTTRAQDYGQSDYNLPIADVTSFIYELPVGRGRRFLSNTNGFVDAVLGGWQTSVINTMQSGTPFNLTYTPSAANQVSPTISNSFRGANLYRPNIVPGVAQKLNTQIAASGYIQYVNPAAFSLPSPTGSPFGNLARNALRNPAFYQTDLSLNKRFSTPDRQPQGGVPHRVLQHPQPHQPVPALHHRRHQRRHGHHRRHRHQHLRAPHHPVRPEGPLLDTQSIAPPSRSHVQNHGRGIWLCKPG